MKTETKPKTKPKTEPKMEARLKTEIKPRIEKHVRVGMKIDIKKQMDNDFSCVKHYFKIIDDLCSGANSLGLDQLEVSFLISIISDLVKKIACFRKTACKLEQAHIDIYEAPANYE